MERGGVFSRKIFREDRREGASAKYLQGNIGGDEMGGAE